MEIIFDAVLAFLASAGILLIAWTLLGGLFPSESIRRGSLVAVYVARGDAESIEQAARAVAWISDSARCRFRMVVADAGLGDGARREAEIFCRGRGIELINGETLFRALLGDEEGRNG